MLARKFADEWINEFDDNKYYSYLLEIGELCYLPDFKEKLDKIVNDISKQPNVQLNLTTLLKLTRNLVYEHREIDKCVAMLAYRNDGGSLIYPKDAKWKEQHQQLLNLL